MKFIVVGGDERMCYMRRMLLLEGHRLTYRAEDAQAVVLPMPLSRDGIHISETDIVIEDFLLKLPRGVPVFAGGHHAGVINYASDPRLVMLNAVPTAEGAIALAIQNSDITLWQSRCLVVGGGRIGRYLALRLKDMGAAVTVSVRRPEDQAMLEAYGLGWADSNCLGTVIGNQDIVFNTVPHMVLGREVLEKAGKSTVIIELASKPGGVDMNVARELKLKAIDAPGLPGKTAPRTAGELIYKTICRMLEEGIGEYNEK